MAKFGYQVTGLNRRVTMKQLISLLLIISITVISWSSFAKSTIIQVNSLYSQSNSSENLMRLKPFLSNQLIHERFSLTSSKTTNNHNAFFETSIVFNEKLQQFIAFFTNSHDETNEVANNNLSSSKNSKSNIQKCKASS